MIGLVDNLKYGLSELETTIVFSQEEKNAMSYVDQVSKSEKLAAIYQHKGIRNNYQLQGLAFHDFITPPQIVGIFCEKYLSNRARPIMVRTKDDVGVSQVVIRVYNSKNELLEKGFAKQYLQQEKWFYFIRSKFDSHQEIRIEAKAVDFPGNMTIDSKRVAV